MTIKEILLLSIFVILPTRGMTQSSAIQEVVEMLGFNAPFRSLQQCLLTMYSKESSHQEQSTIVQSRLCQAVQLMKNGENPFIKTMSPACRQPCKCFSYCEFRTFFETVSLCWPIKYKTRAKLYFKSRIARIKRLLQLAGAVPEEHTEPIFEHRILQYLYPGYDPKQLKTHKWRRVAKKVKASRISTDQ